MNRSNNLHVQIADLRLILELIRAGTVTRAAQRLGTTQSALSYQLDRMRMRFSDPLFVRIGNRMTPTPFAQRLAEPAGRVLHIIETEIADLSSFDPATTEREFRLGVFEIGTIIMVPRVMQRLAALAPRAQLTPVIATNDNMADMLGAGDVDLMAGHFLQPHRGLLQKLLYRVDYVCIARTGHPTIRDTITLREFSRAPLVCTPATITSIEALLRRRGLPMTVAMVCPYLSAVPFMVANSDYVAVIPREIFVLFKPIAAVKQVKLPFNVPTLDVFQYWHPRTAGDPALAFFRKLVEDAIRMNPR